MATLIKNGQGGLGIDADLMSVGGSSFYSSSQQSSTGQSSHSSISQTSKMSKKLPEKKQKKKLRRKRQVKEGSPYEEDNLIEMLKEEVTVTAEDKDQVKKIINALVYF